MLKKQTYATIRIIKTKADSEAAKRTQTQVQTLRIKNEIKFIYRKKQQLNTHLYQTHINNSNIWQQTWDNIERSIEQKLQHEMDKIHKKQQQKINKLMKTQTIQINNNNTQYTHFTHEEIQILNKGLKYNLHYKHKNGLKH
jgi:hypothetical protein